MKVEAQVFPLNLNKDIYKQFLKDNKITWVYLLLMESLSCVLFIVI